MFGTDLHISTFIALLLQLALLLLLMVNCAIKPKELNRRRFMILSLLFICYNLISGIFPTDKINMPMFWQNCMAYSSGIALVLYFIHYLYSEFHISKFRFFSRRHIFAYSILLFVFMFVVPYAYTDNLSMARTYFTLPISLLALLFAFQIIKKIHTLYKKENEQYSRIQRYYGHRLLAAHVAILTILFLPILTFFNAPQYVEQPIVNIGYFTMAFAYLMNHIWQSKRESQLVISLAQRNSHDIQKQLYKSHQLTTKEKEIADLILKELKYKDIGKILYITDKTVSKHASNIFRKFDVHSKSEFIALLQAKLARE